jgi:hypothetical protein
LPYYAADVNNLSDASIILLLKAYTIFKKWQHSNMPLLLIASPNMETQIGKLLSAYKYRNEIIVIASQTDRDDTITAAYAFICLQESPSISFNMQTALATGTPIICTKSFHVESSLGNAALYCDQQQQSIADVMMLLYKQEEQRNRLIEEEMKLATTLHWDRAAFAMSEMIQK